MHLVNAINSLLGKGSGIPTGAAAPAEPKVSFESLLSGIMGTLHDLLGSSSSSKETADFSKDLEFAPEAAPRAKADPLRDFNVEDPEARETLRREIERRLDEAPAAEVAVQIDEIRRFLQQVEPEQGGGEGGEESGAMADEILRALAQVQNKAEVETEMAESRSLPTLSPSLEAPEESVTVAFEETLRRTAESVPAPVEPPVASRPAATPPASELESLPSGITVEEVSTAPPVESEAPAPVPFKIPSVPVTAVAAEGAVRSESAAPGRTESAVRGSAEVRSGDGRNTSLPDQAEGPDTSERAELVERIVKAARLTQSRGAARIKISLNPPHLGNLKVDLSVRQHVLNGVLRADNAAAKEMILSQLQSLRESLEAQGIQVGQLEVRVDGSFAQAQREAERDRGHGAPPPEARKPAVEGLSEVGNRIRSARLQLIDMVA